MLPANPDIAKVFLDYVSKITDFLGESGVPHALGPPNFDDPEAELPDYWEIRTPRGILRLGWYDASGAAEPGRRPQMLRLGGFDEVTVILDRELRVLWNARTGHNVNGLAQTREYIRFLGGHKTVRYGQLDARGIVDRGRRR